MSLIREQQIGLLEVIAYLAVIVVVVGAVVWGWDLNLLLALILLVVAYAVLCDLRKLWRLRQEDEPSRHPRQTIPQENSASCEQPSKPLGTIQTGHTSRANRVDRPVTQTTPALERKGTPHESIGCSKA